MALRSLNLLAALAVMTMVFGSCGDDKADSNSADTSAPAAASNGSGVIQLDADLVGRSFIAQSSSAIDLAANGTLELEFQEDTLFVRGGCNQMRGLASTEGNVLVVGPMGGTLMACEQALMDQDTAVSTFLSSRPTYVLDGDNLTLTGTGGDLVLLDRRIANPDLPLEGTMWTVTSLQDASTVSGVPDGVTATVTIVDGKAQVAAGCNTGNATVTIAETAPSTGTITFAPMALTRKMCDDATMSVENAVTAVLDGEVTYTIVADQMTLVNGTSQLVLQGKQP